MSPNSVASASSVSSVASGSQLTEQGRLLVFAHEAEAEAFADVPHLVTGIGKLSSALTLAHQLMIEAQLSLSNDHSSASSRNPASEHSPASDHGLEHVREIVVLGTAGLIDDSLDLDTVYRVRGALQHDLAFDPPVAELMAEGNVVMHGKFTGKKDAPSDVDLGASTPATSSSSAPISAPISAPASTSTPVSSSTKASSSFDEATAVIATGDAFVSDDELRQDVAARGAGLVDMESYAYAAVAAQFDVPIRIYKVPSDFADSDTTDETWDDVVLRKSHQLYEFAQRLRLF